MGEEKERKEEKEEESILYFYLKRKLCSEVLVSFFLNWVSFHRYVQFVIIH